MNTLSLLKEQLINYQRYEAGQIKMIGHPEYRHSDCRANDFHSYTEWLNCYPDYPVVKVEGIETLDQIKKQFNKFPIQNIHLFVSQQYGFSFKWHSDNVNVFLYVVKGQKLLQVRNKTYIINPRQGIIIPKGHLHRARSRAETWALSVGY
jgi:mannose-6-phosphate isomerase-like protein (cupin superfamily)